MPEGVERFSISMKNKYNKQDEHGNDTTKSCHVYFMVTRVTNGIYSEADMDGWPDGQKQEFLVLPSQAIHFNVLNIVQWHAWNTKSTSTWNLMGSEPDKLCFCGVDEEDKMHETHGSLVFPVVQKDEGKMSDDVQSPDSLDTSNESDVENNQSKNTGVVTQTSSAGKLVMDDEEGSPLFEYCNQFNVIVVFYGLRLSITPNNAS